VQSGTVSAVVPFVIAVTVFVVKTEASDRGNRRRVTRVLVGNFKITKEPKELSSIYLISSLVSSAFQITVTMLCCYLIRCCKSSCGFVNNNRFESHSHFVGLK